MESSVVKSTMHLAKETLIVILSNQICLLNLMSSDAVEIIFSSNQIFELDRACCNRAEEFHTESQASRKFAFRVCVHCAPG